MFFETDGSVGAVEEQEKPCSKKTKISLQHSCDFIYVCLMKTRRRLIDLEFDAVHVWSAHYIYKRNRPIDRVADSVAVARPHV